MYVEICTVILSIVAIVVAVWFGCTGIKTVKQARNIMSKVDKGVVEINRIVKHLKGVIGGEHKGKKRN